MTKAELVGIILTLYALMVLGVLNDELGVANSHPGVLKALVGGWDMFLLAMQLPGVLNSQGCCVLGLHGVACRGLLVG